MTTPCVDDNGDIWFADDSGRLNAVTPQDGVLVRQKQMSDMISSSPVCAHGTVYVSDALLMAANGSTVGLGVEPTVASVAIGLQGEIYVGSWDGTVRCIRNNKVVWSRDVGGQIYSSCSVSSKGDVYVAARSGHIVSISSDGEVRWTRKVGDGVYGTPALSSEGVCFVGSNDRYLYALEQDTGEIRWRERCGRELRSSPLLTPDGLVVVSCWDYSVYAFEGGAGGPCLGGWPQFHCTPSRRGNRPST